MIVGTMIVWTMIVDNGIVDKRAPEPRAYHSEPATQGILILNRCALR
jgi:hypothetical protein